MISLNKVNLGDPVRTWLRQNHNQTEHRHEQHGKNMPDAENPGRVVIAGIVRRVFQICIACRDEGMNDEDNRAGNLPTELG